MIHATWGLSYGPFQANLIWVKNSSISLVDLLPSILQMRKMFSDRLRALALADSMFLLFTALTMGVPRLCEWYATTIFLYVAPFLYGTLHIWR